MRSNGGPSQQPRPYPPAAYLRWRITTFPSGSFTKPIWQTPVSSIPMTSDPAARASSTAASTSATRKAIPFSFGTNFSPCSSGAQNDNVRPGASTSPALDALTGSPSTSWYHATARALSRVGTDTKSTCSIRIVTGWTPPSTARSGDEGGPGRCRERQRFAMLPCSSSTRYFNELDVPAGDLQAGEQRSEVSLRRGGGSRQGGSLTPNCESFASSSTRLSFGWCKGFVGLFKPKLIAPWT